ncbi:MAG TPA: ATP-binding protein [Candidatus Saccharimonadales bacterium]|jgi:PAS domain S-box-containing protein
MKPVLPKRLLAPRIEHGRLTSLINSMADGVIALDRHLKIAMYNGAALNVLDLNSSIDGKAIGKVLRPIDKNNQPVDIGELIKGTKTPATNRDLRLQYEDGSVINLYLNIAPVRTGYGRDGHGGYVLQLRDITREKSLEEERDEFISVVSHELRTPIAIAEGNISNAQFIVNKTTGIAAVKQALKEAHEQVLFLADMINDLATLSRAERGKLTVDVEPINVHELSLELAESYKADAKAKGLQLKTDLDPKLELLQSSKLYVREILQNFITNALKYTEKGNVTIGARPAKTGVEFWVSDTGIGISHSDQEKIFDKFFRSEDFRTRKSGGTGLGLYVTMKLARLLHAEISVDSKLNHGSTFTIFIPNLR